ncbi:MAG: phosphoadenylyl-sulfate reductase [Bacteroidetes bacterium]|nr:MAG: phosphoadenylyl-sulfate reductase [Bacteroidota bacterium]
MDLMSLQGLSLVEGMNKDFEKLSAEERLARLFEIVPEEEVLVTSSFGIHSATLLHHLSRIKPGIKVYFINTRFHFPETLEYKAQLSTMFGLNVVEVAPSEDLKDLCVSSQMWTTTPNVCCYLNKVAPLEPLKKCHKVWISGLMGFQNRVRNNWKVFRPDPSVEGLLKFHPFIDWSEAKYENYRNHNALPPHPLELEGYGSVGCIHCTQKAQGRAGRWNSKFKTECGLHIGFLSKS